MDVEGGETNSEVRHQSTNCDENVTEENESDGKTVAVTTQESLDGIREKAMRIASIDELETSSSAGRWISLGESRE